MYRTLISNLYVSSVYFGMSVIIDTNNFKQVLLYFNHEGELADKQDTRVAIDCAICREKQLAIVNPNFDQLGNDTHEPYIVLPLCGHAFGAKCLLNVSFHFRIGYSRNNYKNG